MSNIFIMIQARISVLPKYQILIGYNHNIENDQGENESYTIHTIQFGFIFIILEIVSIRERK